MRAIYRLSVTGEGPDPAVSESINLDPTEIGGVRVEIDCDPETRRLTEVRLIFTGAEMRFDPDRGTILSSYPELEAAAFSAASFVANVLRFETGVDGIDPYQVPGNRPEITAESPEEQEEFRNRRITATRSVRAFAAIQKLITPEEWQEWGRRAGRERVRKAMASYAEGARAHTPFLQYEQFFKVFEHFFPDKQGKHLDKAVSRHLVTYDSTIDESTIKHIREVRIRSMHADPHRVGPHLSPQQLADLREITAALPTLRQLVRLLLSNPPRE